MTKARDELDHWIAEVFGTRQRPLPVLPEFKAPPTPAERKRAQTAEAARQIIQAEKDQRQANSARLRQVRLEKEAQRRATGDGDYRPTS